MKHKKLLLIGALLCAILAVSVYAVVIKTIVVTHTGEVKTVGDFEIYSNVECTNILTSQLWPQVNKGDFYQVDAWIKHTSTEPNPDDIYISWSVSGIPTYLTLEMKFDTDIWLTGNKRVILEGQIIPIVFKLTVASNAEGGAFAFDQSFIGEDTA